MRRILDLSPRRLSLMLAGLFLIVESILRFATVGATPDVSGLAGHATESAQRFATRRVGLPPEKAAVIDRQATRDAMIILTPSRPPPSLIPINTPEPIYGILQFGLNPYNRGQPAENQWHGVLNGRNIGVWAGTTDHDPTLGMVGVAVQNLDGKIDPYVEYPTPRKAGSVHITDVTGTKVSLLAVDGTVFTFDLQTMSFV